MADGARMRPCANPECNLVAHNDPETQNIHDGYCCEKCWGRHTCQPWAQKRPYHYKNCSGTLARDGEKPTLRGGGEKPTLRGKKREAVTAREAYDARRWRRLDPAVLTVHVPTMQQDPWVFINVPHDGATTGEVITLVAEQVGADVDEVWLYPYSVEQNADDGSEGAVADAQGRAVDEWGFNPWVHIMPGEEVMAWISAEIPTAAPRYYPDELQSVGAALAAARYEEAPKSKLDEEEEQEEEWEPSRRSRSSSRRSRAPSPRRRRSRTPSARR